MMVLQVRDVTKEYQGAPVLTGVTFHLTGGERLGLVGANGCGKSTLMKILAGTLSADGGTVAWVTDGLARAYLSQESPFAPDRPLGEQIGAAPDDALLARCGIAPEMLRQTPATLSGGQKTRAALARALTGQPDLLLLDEPTNHLDTEGLAWLENVLAGYRGTVLVVSHDRYFLDRVVTRILEMENGKVREYPGNYTAFAQIKRMELERAREEYRNYVREKKRIEEAIRRQMAWAVKAHHDKPPRTEGKYQLGMNKDAARDLWKGVKNMEKRLERMKVDKPREARTIHLRIDQSGSSARNLILAEDLGFTYDGARWLFRHAGFYVQRGDRVAIVGPNGAGKTTLLRLLLRALTPTEGRLYCSPLRTAYLAQEMETLNPANTVLVEATGSSLMDQAYARSLLGCLLFSGEDVLKPVAVLSGGEKVRLALAKILLAAPDMLVLDEPTNGLDLPSRERVEEALGDYPGTLLLVSHDRYLLRRIATRVISVGGGKLAAFGGGYAAFQEQGRRQEDDDRQAQRILLEMRLAQLSAQLAAPPEADKERLNAEFLEVSRKLRGLRA
ncbi:MAG TPA: ABC-F type ribosomal protection protein [Symbiobacteriaceae bacterium]|nr:ABC-F type ribosomal protection protein [Symbiobacteriaceae bacterium]